MWFVKESVRCRLLVQVDNLHKARLLTPTPQARTSARLTKTNGSHSAGGIYRSRDQSGRGETATAGSSADDYAPLSQLRSRTEARQRERDRDRWEERWDTNTQIQRGREKSDREIISHCIACWQMPISIHTKHKWFHTTAQKTELRYKPVERGKRWNNTSSGAIDTFLCLLLVMCAENFILSVFVITITNSSMS